MIIQYKIVRKIGELPQKRFLQHFAKIPSKSGKVVAGGKKSFEKV